MMAARSEEEIDPRGDGLAGEGLGEGLAGRFAGVPGVTTAIGEFEEGTRGLAVTLCRTVTRVVMS